MVALKFQNNLKMSKSSWFNFILSKQMASPKTKKSTLIINNKQTMGKINCLTNEKR